MTTNGSIKLAMDALQEAKTAYNEGRLRDARALLRFVSHEAEDASHGLNAAIAQTVVSDHDKQ